MYKSLEVALRAGEIMLKNGSETFRAQNIMELILDDTDAKDRNVTIIGSAIILTIQDEKGMPYTMSKSIFKRKNNLHKIGYVSQISEKYSKGEISLDSLKEKLEKVDNSTTYPPVVKIITTALAVSAFTVGYGGNLFGALAILLITLLPAYVIEVFRRNNIPFFLSNILAGIVISFLSVIAYQFYPQIQYDKMIASVIIILTPGIMAITAIRDLVNGDFITGASRSLEALILATGLSIGVGFILYIYSLITGGVVWKF